VKQAFLDTSGWFAALSSKEAHHRLAMTTYRGWIEEGRQLVTTNLVLSEMQILLMRFRGVSAGVQFLDSVHQDPGHDVIYVDRDLERAAVARWLHRFSDQQISLADAVSFEVMRQPRIRSVLALDEHFTTAGFDAVP
jgi:predicted nucleic acid-binding protein